MKNLVRYCVIGLLLIFASGCANLYTRNELSAIFGGKGFETREIDRGLVVLFPEVFFEFDSDVLTQSAHNQLLLISDVLNDPRAEVRPVFVEGHTDSVGDERYNESLSLRRANMVANALVDRGVNENRVSRRGYGRKYPIAPNTTPEGRDNPEGRSQNRRVEIILIDDI